MEESGSYISKQLIKILLIILLAIFLLVIGLVIGYAVVGKGHPLGVFSPKTWTHITDFLK